MMWQSAAAQKRLDTAAHGCNAAEKCIANQRWAAGSMQTVYSLLWCATGGAEGEAHKDV